MKSVFDYNQMIASWDSEIRKGNTREVKEDMFSLNSRRIPSNHRLDIARLSRRVGANHFALKVITPLVLLKDSQLRSDVSFDCLAEYALLLQRLGMPINALRHLDPIAADKYPRVDLYRAYCYFNMWNYERAIPHLKAYTQSSEISSYDKLIGQVNLLAALTSDRQLQEATELGAQLVASTHSNKSTRLELNCLEICTQLEIHQNNYNKARDYIERANKLTKNNIAMDSVFVEKWRSFLKSVDKGDCDDLIKFRFMAQEYNHWESVREADYLCLKIKFDRDIFNRVLYGSSQVNYQSKIINEFLQDLPLPHQIVIGNQEQYIDLFQGRLFEEDLLPVGSMTHQLLCALFYDLYRPAPLGSLFEIMYPGEIFDIFNSPNRVHQLITKLRKSLSDYKQVELVKIAESRGRYLAYCNKDFGFSIRLKKELPQAHSVLFARLLEKSTGKILTAQRIGSLLELPKTSASRLIKKCVEVGLMEKRGRGPSTKYELISHPAKEMRESA